ncbi:MAG: hypothetical protein ACR2RE_28625 [Geminicoccaceae bacterium]
MTFIGHGRVWRQHDECFLGEFRYQLAEQPIIIQVGRGNQQVGQQQGTAVRGTVQGLDDSLLDQLLTIEIEDGRRLDFWLRENGTITAHKNFYLLNEPESSA